MTVRFPAGTIRRSVSGPFPLNPHVERVVRITAGVACLIIGVIGGFIPVLQGWAFILAGLALLAPYSRRAQQALEWAKKKVGQGDKAEGESDSQAEGPRDPQRPGESQDPLDPKD